MKVTLLQPIGARPGFHAQGTTHEFADAHAQALIDNGMAEKAPADAQIAVEPPAPAKAKTVPAGALAALLLFLCGLLSARADQSSLIGDFQITNTLASGVAIVGYPTNTPVLSTNTLAYTGTTNSVTTNNIGVGTGGFLNIGAYSDLSLDFTCFPTLTGGTNSDSVTIQLVRSHAQNPPYASLFQWWNSAGFIQSTNQGGTNSIYYNPWESSKALPSQLSITIAGIGGSGDSNAFHWHTNLSNLLGKEGGQYIGVYSITNGSTNALALATILSNCDLTLSGKKILLFP